MVSTEPLLRSLLAVQLSRAEETGHADLRLWIDRVIQRFEVTKRLYEGYLPSFRKGQGPHTEIRPYWLFGLVLSLACAEFGSVRYLSTLLKVDDLLCSLPPNEVADAVPAGGMSVVIGTEVSVVLELASRQGVSIAAG